MSFILPMLVCSGRFAEVPGSGRAFVVTVVDSHSHNFGPAVVAVVGFVGAATRAAASEESAGP